MASRTKAAPVTDPVEIAARIAELQQQQRALQQQEDERIAAERAAEATEAARIIRARAEFAIERGGVAIRQLGADASAARAAFDAAVADDGDILGAWRTYRIAKAAVYTERVAQTQAAAALHNVAADVLGPIVERLNVLESLSGAEGRTGAEARSAWQATAHELNSHYDDVVPVDQRSADSVHEFVNANGGPVYIDKRGVFARREVNMSDDRVETFAEAYESALSKVVAAVPSQFNVAFRESQHDD